MVFLGQQCSDGRLVRAELSPLIEATARLPTTQEDAA
jgi:hypothetical protein